MTSPHLHPHRALGSKPSWVKELAQALLRVQDVNVLVVDWVYGASFAYNLVVENYKEVALQISVLINQLQVRETPDRIQNSLLFLLLLIVFHLNNNIS